MGWTFPRQGNRQSKRFGHSPVREVVKVNDLGVSPQEVLEMEARMSGQDVAFDGYEDDEQDSSYAPVHYLEDKSSDMALALENDDWEHYAEHKLSHALSCLDERSQHIIRRRWLDDDKATLQELADHYAVSAERIRQLEKNALKRLKDALEA